MTDNISNYEYRAPRVRVNFPVLVHTSHHRAAILNARCIDLSEDGLAAELLCAGILAPEIRDSLEVGREVTIIMTLPGHTNTTKLAARVTNHKVGSYGFAFIFSSKAEQDYIHQYFESRHRSIRRSAD